MANHKRGRPKHQRAGCLMCKPHKDERAGQDRGPSREKSDIAYMLDDHRYGEDPHPECFCEDCMKWDGGP